MTGTQIVVATVILVLAVGGILVERGSTDPRRIAVIAALAAAAAVGRVVCAAVPSVSPVTIIVLVTGATLGARAGFAVGALTPLISNLALGHGPWTPGQMALWGIVGLSGAALRSLCRRPRTLAVIGVAWGFLFGWGMNLWEMTVFGPTFAWSTFVARATTSVSFDVAHAAGNAIFALALGPALIRLLVRYQNRIATTVQSPVAATPQAPAHG